MLQQTWLCLLDLSVSPELQIFDQQINTSMQSAVPSNMLQSHQCLIRFHKKILLSSLTPDVGNFVAKYTAQRSYKLFKTVFFKGQRLSTDRTDTLGKIHDGCLMYRRNNVLAIGFLEAIISFDHCSEPTFVIRPVNLISTDDSLPINGRIFRCTNVLYGTRSETTLEVTNSECIIQKLAFRPGNDTKFPTVRNLMLFFNIRI